MGYRTLQHCVNDLQKYGHLIVFDQPISANLEMAEVQRRVYLSGGPAVLFSNVEQCKFPMVSNLFGSVDRAKFIFRDALENVRRAIELKIDPSNLMKQPWRYWRAPLTASTMRPKLCSMGPILANQTSIDQLPQLKSWPDDAGAFITLPQVYSENVAESGVQNSNLGMYRIQLSGNNYQANSEVGLHYQIHRGIGVHQSEAIKQGKPFRVNIFVGGTPAMTLAAVMPLPEGLSELTFAGALAGHRIRMIRQKNQLPIYAEADFCITGIVHPEKQLPEGPFGDHLGYYSLAHPFPVLQVEKVYHRHDAIWPFTVVGRPPQEDTTFGELIHEITDPIIPTVIPGVKAVNAVDAAGVHPLLLAIGSERYVPYQKQTQPQELLTQANAILGQGQMSLAKYVLIVNQQDDPELDIHKIDDFFIHLLKRIDWRRDLHFQTRTTIDTLDYSGTGLNQGSKVVMAYAGDPIRELLNEVPRELKTPPLGFSNPTVRLPGILVLDGPSYDSKKKGREDINRFCTSFNENSEINKFPLIVIVDEAGFTARTLNNFLWVTFTRSNPAADIHGICVDTEEKHWGCRGSLVIDARIKPQHAPPLVEDPKVTQKVDAIAAKGGSLAKYL